jgi:hypothetical protein
MKQIPTIQGDPQIPRLWAEFLKRQRATEQDRQQPDDTQSRCCKESFYGAATTAVAKIQQRPAVRPNGSIGLTK